ncbi:MAG: SpoIIE family protein phosphatase [Bacteroidota bacterium]|nr:SpoIIE family protein phosphatase [Bacteroidota bacterium]
MVNTINQIWNKLSLIGLRKGEGVLEFREVIFLNRMLILLPLVMFFYIPVEIYFNGFSMLPMVVGMILLLMISIPLHYFRLFRISKYYLFLIANLMLANAGLSVGKGINNHVSLIPVVLISVLIFKTKIERILALLITIAFFSYGQYLFDIVPPYIYVSAENKEVFSFIFFLLALLLTFIIGTYFLGINKEYEKIVITQKEALGLINKEIIDSINYAKRIQEAILPPLELIKEKLPNSFILYKPKDIVAGDFYWMEESNDTIFIASADCTGHGVPGAMVSVVCITALNRAVKEFNLTDTGKILDKVTELVLETFKKSAADVKDGMDISLLSINKKNQTLQWSGANNPLWYFEKKELKIITADKQPIGKSDYFKPFTTHLLEYKPGLTLYLFTDGYADQFGGPNGKKFKYNQFKEKISSIVDTDPYQQQLALNITFDNWKGQLEQVDDVCVIGIKI